MFKNFKWEGARGTRHSLSFQCNILCKSVILFWVSENVAIILSLCSVKNMNDVLQFSKTEMV
jgi:hypothetical protein